MRTVAALLAVPFGLPFLFVPPAHADSTIGGAKLSGHGYIWDKSSSTDEPPHIAASSYVIADLDTGAVLAAKDPHGEYRPASTLKTLTSITLIPRLDPKKLVEPSNNAVNASGSAVGLSTKWKYTINDLFHGLLMQSGNDAAIALAEAAGGMKPTLAAMNAEAHRINALDTIARTPNGLDDDPPLTLKQQHSSAYDLALIMKQGLKLPDFRKYIGATLYDWPAPPTEKEREKGKKTGGYQIGTHDHLLLGDSYNGMIGGKNGWTSHALGSFAGAATRHGHTIIISLMHAQSDFWPDARSLLDWGFAHRTKVSPIGTLVDPVPPPSPKPVPAHRPAAAVASPSPGGIAWWQIGIPGTVVILAAALVLFIRHRRHATAGAPPTPAPGGHVRPADADGPTDVNEPADRDAKAASRMTPPGDTKVAGAPLDTTGGATPRSWETAPNPPRHTPDTEDTEDTEDTDRGDTPADAARPEDD